MRTFDDKARDRADFKNEVLLWFPNISTAIKFPDIVCLCGSTRFYKTFDEQNLKLTLEGKLVLSIGCNTKNDKDLNVTAEDKVKLDELHKRKIDLCDYILVLNVDGYIGESTHSEIEYAKQKGVRIEYLFPPAFEP